MKIQISEVGENVPRYCRKIMKQEGYPTTLEIYRSAVLYLTVDVAGASRLRLVENEKEGPLYKKYYESSFIANRRCHVASTGEFK